MIENPNAQKYNENLERLYTLNSEQLSTLLFNFESEEEAAVSDEDQIIAEMIRKGDENMKKL